ncbi:NAD(P)-binding protein [Hyphomicrobiales bacterium]|jgi:predicted NAD/FAD-binding protein|nr:NAD(P)-binding protein [Hyphomicrobiales bacterium]|tara:strand:+ start:329 stop:1600 length:1272 start_codon:yes stop_codon:yes gene_type:complete
MKFAIVGSGISGLSIATILSQDHEVVLYEKEDRYGGHSNTVEINYNNEIINVDTGFIVFNKLNYPNLIKFFKYFSVKYEDSDMSLSIKHQALDLEWSGQNLKTIFSKKKLLKKISFISSIIQILIFNFHIKYLINYKSLGEVSLREWLENKPYTKGFLELYLLPMAGAIWSMPPEDVMNYPITSLFNFFNNHKLLHSKNDRPQWLTVSKGSINYVNKIIRFLGANPRVETYKDTQILKIKRSENTILIEDSNNNQNKFDHIIFSTNPTKTLEILEDVDEKEKNILDKFSTNTNLAYLHNDETLMPKLKKVWSSWNVVVPEKKLKNISVTYWMNKLQNIKNSKPLFLSLNPIMPPKENSIFKVIEYEHPIFDIKAINSKKLLKNIQGYRNTWHCGAWSGNGFHEDGITSSVNLAKEFDAKVLWE